MKWHQIWAARFGESFDNTALAIWDEEMKHEIKNLQPDEILNGVRAIADQKRKGELKYKPTLNHLISAIILARYQARNGGDRAEVYSKREDRVNALKAKVRYAMPDRTKAWTAICEDGNIENMREVETWAEGVVGFVRPTLREMGCTPFREVLAMATSGEMRRVTDEIKTRSTGA